MAFISINNVNILGMATAVPKQKRINSNTKFISSTGIEEMRISPENICTSDLCFEAAEQLIKDLNVDKQEIEMLLFFTALSRAINFLIKSGMKMKKADKLLTLLNI
jgi:3-oxoacyl-[acyl-carrier-protein] synthase-3